MSQPGLVLLPSHLSWVFLLQLSQHQLALPVICWLLLQQLSPLSLWHATRIFFIDTMATLTNILSKPECGMSGGRRACLQLKAPPFAQCGRYMSG